MSLNRTELSYRKMAIEGASPIGLLVALFDILIGDLRRGAAALHSNDIETRCRELNHAALVLGQLESWIDRNKGGESALILTRFYAQIRAKIMEASVKKSAKILETQIDGIVQVRTAWQKLDSGPMEAPAKPADHPVSQLVTSFRSTPEKPIERIPFSQSC